MQKGTGVAVALLLLLAGATLVVVAESGQSAAPQLIVPYDELSFTDFSEVEALDVLGTQGFLAATRGGLIVWPGGDDRRVLTRTDGLPSNLVWDVQLLNEGVLVATENGAALVDLGTYTAVPIPADEAATRILTDHTIRAEQVNDTLYVLDRDGELAIRAPDGTWTTVEGTGLTTATQAFFTDERVLLSATRQVSGIHTSGIFELAPNNTWQPIVVEHNRLFVEVAAFDDILFVGTRGRGLNTYDLDGEAINASVPVELGRATIKSLTIHGNELWVGSTIGLHIYNAADATWRWIEPGEHLPHAWVMDVLPIASVGQGAPKDIAVVGTPIGVGWPAKRGDKDGFLLHRTVNGPVTNTFLSASLREAEAGPEIWLGTEKGASIYYPDAQVWWHIGPQDGLRSAPVYSITHDHDESWFGTRYGVHGLDRDHDRWHTFIDEVAPQRPGNIYYHVEKDGSSVWMAELGNGLLRHDFATGKTSRYHIPQGLFSPAITCATRWHEFLTVCSDEGIQFFNLTRSSELFPLGVPYDFCDSRICGKNYPTNRTFTVQIDGPRVWTGTVFDGVVLIAREGDGSLGVAGHWNMDDGLPDNEVRALATAPNGVWVGTVEGLALLHERDGVVRTWGHEDGLDDTQINGLVQVEDMLYVATLSGLFRLDTNSGEFLPLVESDAEIGSVPARLRVLHPPEGSVLKAPINVTGTVIAPGRAVDRVEGSVDGGPWQAASGTDSWRFPLAVHKLSDGKHTASFRVLAGGDVIAWANRTFEVAGTPVDQLDPPDFKHDPPKEAVRGQVLTIEGQVSGEDPLSAILHADVGGEDQTSVARISGGAATFTLRLPDYATGTVEYTIEVFSGAGERVFPASGTYSVPIDDARVRALAVSLEDHDGIVEAEPGAGPVEFTGRLTNEGNRAETIHLSALGLRSNWISFAPPSVLVPPGESVLFGITIDVPGSAGDGSQAFVITARSADGVLSEEVSLTVDVQGAAELPDEDDPDRDTPGPALPLALALVAGAALVLRRREER